MKTIENPNVIVNDEIEIKFLVDCQEHLYTLAKLWYEEISRHWVSSSSVEKASGTLAKHLNSDKLPIAIVALHKGKPVGMVCLRENDGIRQGVTPWLGSLVVDPKYRGRKIGERLIESIKTLARSHGYTVLHLLAFDPTIPKWYMQLGWQFIGEDEYLGHRVTVMNIAL